VLREIFGIIRKEINEDVYNSFPQSNIITMNKARRVGWSGHVARKNEENRNLYRIFVVKSEGKKPLGRIRCRREDNISRSSGKKIIAYFPVIRHRPHRKQKKLG
jgi:hypothetical protein